MGFGAGNHPYTPLYPCAHPPFSPHFLPCAWTKKKRGAKKERAKKRREIVRITVVL
jgi:hypothetical protein